MENKKTSYIGGLLSGIKTLLIGMKTTITVFFRKKVTEQYPENRKELVMFDRFRGTLVMPHDEEGKNKCIACGLCQMTCPNDTLDLTIDTVTTEEGKSKKVLVKYMYDQGACIFCQLCVNVCPTGAIEFAPKYECAVFDRDVLKKQLNK